MAWFDQLDERVQRWYWRVAGKQLVPPASVEKTLKESSVQEHQEPGEASNSVSLSEETPSTEEVSIPALHELDTHPRLPTMERVEALPLMSIQNFCREASGSGKFESGQCDVVVANPHVTTSSVVVVILTGNPGPVVVQYVSLDPGKGFTVHLSAPTNRITPFNYVIM